MRIVISYGGDFPGGGGPGGVATRLVSYLHQQGHLSKLIVGYAQPQKTRGYPVCSMGLGNRMMRKLASYDTSGRANHWGKILFDHWASRHIPKCDLFFGWHNQCLFSLRRARNLGAVTVVQRGASHPIDQADLLDAEYERWGSQQRVRRQLLQRGLRELDEADFIATPSDFSRKTFLAQGVAASSLIGAPYGVELERFTPAVKSDDTFRVLFVGQVGFRKGVPYLLEAWKQLDLSDAELLLVGDIMPEMRPFLAGYHCPNSVRFVGWVGDPVALYQSSDVFVLPSIEDGYALVVLEAMASGLPVIVSENVGAKDVVTESTNGFIVPINDIDALAESILDLYEHPEKRARMGRSARERAEDFTWEKYGQQMVAQFERIVGARQGK